MNNLSKILLSVFLGTATITSSYAMEGYGKETSKSQNVYRISDCTNWTAVLVNHGNKDFDPNNLVPTSFYGNTEENITRLSLPVVKAPVNKMDEVD